MAQIEATEGQLSEVVASVIEDERRNGDLTPVQGLVFEDSDGRVVVFSVWLQVEVSDD